MTTASSRDPALRDKGQRRGMTGPVGSFVVRRARLVLVAARLAVVGFGVLGFGAFGKLQTGGFQDPGAGSTTAQTLTDQRFGGSVGVVLLVHAEPDHGQRRRDQHQTGAADHETSYWPGHRASLPIASRGEIPAACSGHACSLGC